MKKRLISLFTILSLIITVFPSSIVQAGNYGNMTEEAFISKVNSLRSTFVHGKYWNRYNDTLERTGDKKCPCGYSTCPGWDSCSCGVFVYNGAEIGWQCHGYALKLGNLIFGGNPNTWSIVKNVNNVCAGDIARLDNNNHSIFIYKVDGDNIYYTDCNAIGRCQVNWNGYMTKSKLSSRLSWIYHLSGNSLKGIVSNPVQPIHKDENPHVRNGYCTIKNVASGKFMNVYAGSDANYTSVCMWAYDDSTDQHFRLDHKGGGKYKLYAYCSSRGTNRVVDVNRGTDAPAEGDKIQLWTPDDDTSQLYYPYPVGNDEYVFELASKNGYVLAPNGGGDANSDGAQLVLQRYTGAAHQKWRFCDNNGQVRNNNVSYTPGYYTVNTNGTPIVRRKAADPFAEVLSGYDINDKETVYVSQVNNFWGYTEHAGIGGWICLDYTKSTVVLESISISSMPDKTSYFVGEKFDTLGLKITANYSNGQKEELSNGFSVSCNIDQPGTKQAIVTYKDKTASFDVNVQNVSVSAISVQENNIKKTYTVGDTLDTTGLSLMVGYNNGTTDIIDSGYTTDYDFSSAGTKTVTITYGGQSTSYDVTVTGTSHSEKASVLVSSAECEAGGNAVVYISLSGNNIYDGNMTIQYDSSKLTLTDAKACDALSGRMVSINPNYATDKVRVSFSGTDMIKSGADILRLEFTASTSEGTANIAVSEARLYDLSANTIEATLGTGSVNIYPAVSAVEISNVQSETVNGMKVLTANTNNNNIICYLAAYDNGKLVKCDVQEPENGKIKLSVSDGYQTKFMVWSRSMKPLINPKIIY